MRRACLIQITLFLFLAIFPTAPSPADTLIVDARELNEPLISGADVLTVDYIGIWNNEVMESGPDYPYGDVTLLLYDPGPYAKQPTMDESDWRESDELARFKLSGPSANGLWANGDEVIYTHFGLYNWRSGTFDSIVFRMTVDNPDKSIDVETLIWGVIGEEDTLDSDYEFRTDQVSIYFRTTSLPEQYSLPAAQFSDTWFEHGVESGDVRGIMLHTNFQIDNLRAITCRIAGFVHYADSGESVKCQLDDPNYMTPSGFITVQRDFIPIYPSTQFSDFTMFIPYDVFPVSEDFVDYTISLEILDGDWNYVNSDVSPEFSVKKPS